MINMYKLFLKNYEKFEVIFLSFSLLVNSKVNLVTFNFYYALFLTFVCTKFVELMLIIMCQVVIESFLNI